MLNILISAVFKLIQILGTILITPIMSVISGVLDSIGFSQYASAIIDFINLSLTYIDFIIEVLHVPRVALALVLGFGATVITFNIALYVVSLVINIYSFVKTGHASQSFIADKKAYDQSKK